MTFWDTPGKLYNSLRPLHCTDEQSLAYLLGWKTRIIEPITDVAHISDGIPYRETKHGYVPIPAPTLGVRSCYYLEESFKLNQPANVKDYNGQVKVYARVVYKNGGFSNKIVHSEKVHDSVNFPIGEWLPGSEMPKWFARKYFIVASLRTERMQDLTETDAREYGIQRYAGGYYYRDYSKKNESKAEYLVSALDSLRSLFEFYAKEGKKKKQKRSLWNWDANPLVWSISLLHLANTDRRGRVL